MTNKVALIVALVLGAIAIWGINAYVAREHEKAMKGIRPIQVAVLKRDVAPGDELSPEIVRFDEFPERLLDSLQDAVRRTDVEAYYRRKFAMSVKGDQIVQASHFPSVARETAIELGANERATTIAVDYVSGVAGMLRPGHFVDVLGTFTIETAHIGKYDVTMTVAKKRLILAIDQFTETHGGGRIGGYRTVTLRVNPREAEWLVYTANFGKATLVLRNDTDEVQEGPSSVDIFDSFREASKGKSLKVERE